jgi:hypothetical protein
MLITELKGMTFNVYGNTSDPIPKGWVEIEYDGRKKNHKKFLESKHTRVIKKLEGWKGPKKHPKPIISFWTDTPDIVENILRTGYASNALDFITGESS